MPRPTRLPDRLARNHALSKYRKRYGGHLTPGDYQKLCRELGRGRRAYGVVCPAGDTRLLIHFGWRGQTVYAIFDPRSQLIITFYTEAMAASKHLRHQKRRREK